MRMVLLLCVSVLAVHATPVWLSGTVEFTYSFPSDNFYTLNLSGENVALSYTSPAFYGFPVFEVGDPIGALRAVSYPGHEWRGSARIGSVSSQWFRLDGGELILFSFLDNVLARQEVAMQGVITEVTWERLAPREGTVRGVYFTPEPASADSAEMVENPEPGTLFLTAPLLLYAVYRARTRVSVRQHVTD
jgi:hypothetical protein